MGSDVCDEVPADEKTNLGAALKDDSSRPLAAKTRRNNGFK